MSYTVAGLTWDIVKGIKPAKKVAVTTFTNPGIAGIGAVISPLRETEYVCTCQAFLTAGAGQTRINDCYSVVGTNSSDRGTEVFIKDVTITKNSKVIQGTGEKDHVICQFTLILLDI